MLPEYEDSGEKRLQDPLELRATPRVATDLPVQVFTTDLVGALPGRARDVSIGGACIATATPFAFKSVQRIVIALPQGSITLDAEGCWQRDAEGDDVVLTGLSFGDLAPEGLDALWELVFASGKRLARFLYEQTELHEFGVEEGLGLAQLTRFRQIPAGRCIYRQGTQRPGEDSLFLVVSGEVGLQVRVRDAVEIETERLGVGAIFGGLPLLAGTPHAESAVALADSRLLEIDAHSFRYLRVAKPWLGYRLSQVLLRINAARVTRLLARLRDEL